MPGRVELHLIDTMAVGVVAQPAGLAAIGALAGGQGGCAAQPGAMLAQRGLVGCGAFALYGLAQDQVGFIQGIVFQGRYLVDDGMGGERRHRASGQMARRCVTVSIFRKTVQGAVPDAGGLWCSGLALWSSAATGMPWWRTW